jgi:hypothetical protein
MTYAYINTVYPDFKTEIPVVNYKEYRNIKQVQSNTTNLDNYSPFKDKLDDTLFKKDQINSIKVKEINDRNLQFHNEPIKPTIRPDTIETIENTGDIDHSVYIKHVANCEVCKKGLNLELDKIKMDEWMELISYIVFGIFILLLIDNLK